MIEATELVKFYGTTKAVDHISFSLQPGEIVGLLGPNGAGKSTTLKMLTGYIPPTEGSIVIDGVDVQQSPLQSRKNVGYLSENNPLYESMGVWECLELFAEFHKIPPKSIKKRLYEVVDQCALVDVISKDISQLSKGYKQRLGMALAILHDPKILILDEPTSALDPIQQKDVRHLIGRLKEEKTVLLSTHILPEAQNICDRLLIIHQGKIVAQGTVTELQGQMSGENSFYIRLKGPKKAIEDSLKKMAILSHVEYKDEAEKECPGFQVLSPNDPRTDLFGLAVDKKWPVMELKKQSATLDEIFQSLTDSNT